MKRIDRWVAAVDRVVAPKPRRSFLASARAVAAYGDGNPTGEAAVALARWIETGRSQGPCGRG